MLHISEKYKNILGNWKPKKGSLSYAGKKLQTLFEREIDELPIVQHNIARLSTIFRFEDYLNDENMCEIIHDKYIIPVLISISKYPSKTFGPNPELKLSIIVFEYNNENIIISPPLGGFTKNSNSMILLYKERDHQYEPIIFQNPGKDLGIIQEYDKPNDDQNDTMNIIIRNIQDKIDEFTNIDSNETIMDISELENVMKMPSVKLPIVHYIYDNYNKIIHIVTEKNVLIPIRPSNIESHNNCIYFPELLEKDYPLYDDVIHILKIIDDNSTYKKYLLHAGISVVEDSLIVKEIILEDGHYIPIKPEIYNIRKHKLNVVSLNSYRDIDNKIIVNNHYSKDDQRGSYIKMYDSKKYLTETFFQNAYIMIHEDKLLLDKINNIKNHDIKLRIHKAIEIYELLDKGLFKKYEADVKIKKLFVQLLIIYDETDYDRFLQLDVNFTKLRQALNEKNELLFTYSDIIHERYLEYFFRSSIYINNKTSMGKD